MAAAGIHVCEQNIPLHLLKESATRRAINMAFDMIDYTSTISYGDGVKICIKIGIHTGTVIAGVIGNLKLIFLLKFK